MQSLNEEKSSSMLYNQVIIVVILLVYFNCIFKVKIRLITVLVFEKVFGYHKRSTEQRLKF